MILIIICVLPRVFSEVTSQHVNLSRKSRSSLEPFETVYVSSQGEDGPGIHSNFETEVDVGGVNRFPKSAVKYIETKEPYTYIARLSLPLFDSSQVTKRSLPEKDMVVIEKSNSKYSPGFLPSKIKTDAMYEHLKSAMYYKPPFQSESMFGYESDYHIDDDDIRTSSRGIHDSWPYHYYNPYEYEHMRIDVEKEKAKDKRYAVDAAKIIPIHEDLSDDIPYSQDPILTTTEFYYTSTDNPISGHDPFFSVMLNDYFTKNYDYGDQLNLKGIDWNSSNEHVDNSRFRRLPSDQIENSNIGSNTHHKYNDLGTAIESNSNIEKGIAHKNNFKKHEEGNNEKANDHTEYHDNEEKQMGFRDFVDSFANKFGSEDHKKDSKYIMKRNQDKGENRKGFRRVYHKDEYQEDKEFYDNNKSSVIAEDKGSSNAHIGGSEGLLKSSSAANSGNHANAYNKSGDSEKNKFENNHIGYDDKNNYYTQFHKYRDVAKQAAHSNDAADYTIH